MYCFSGKHCYKPGDLDLVLKQSRVEYEEQFHIEQKLKENCTDNGLEYHGDTPRNGDCFFEAIASQLSRIKAQQSALSPLQLRQKVSEYIWQNPTYDVSISSIYCISSVGSQNLLTLIFTKTTLSTPDYQMHDTHSVKFS